MQPGRRCWSEGLGSRGNPSVLTCRHREVSRTVFSSTFCSSWMKKSRWWWRRRLEGGGGERRREGGGGKEESFDSRDWSYLLILMFPLALWTRVCGEGAGSVVVIPRQLCWAALGKSSACSTEPTHKSTELRWERRWLHPVFCAGADERPRSSIFMCHPPPTQSHFENSETFSESCCPCRFLFPPRMR